MKKSVFKLVREKRWIEGQDGGGAYVVDLVQRDIAAAEAAGVTWDAEEPLAERLKVAGACRSPWLIHEDGESATLEEVTLAAELYNRRKTILSKYYSVSGEDGTVDNEKETSEMEAIVEGHRRTPSQ